ncbi:hypothetical protein JL722_15048 [Aureococcus anophagefferens]|nr:hypothetical protein JL722_15048 [Aureococcus anophagefferens]
MHAQADPSQARTTRVFTLEELASWVNGTYHDKYVYRGVLGGGYFFDATGRSRGGRGAEDRDEASSQADATPFPLLVAAQRRRGLRRLQGRPRAPAAALAGDDDEPERAVLGAGRATPAGLDAHAGCAPDAANPPRRAVGGAPALETRARAADAPRVWAARGAGLDRGGAAAGTHEEAGAMDPEMTREKYLCSWPKGAGNFGS